MPRFNSYATFSDDGAYRRARMRWRRKGRGR